MPLLLGLLRDTRSAKPVRAARAMTGRVSLVAARSPLFIEMGLADDAVDELRREPRFVTLDP